MATPTTTRGRTKPLVGEELEALLALTKDADSVELKLSVPESDQRSTVVALGIDPLDAELRQVVDARNELDAATYQVERRLSELGDQVPVNEKGRAEMLIADARMALKEDAPLGRIRSLTSELQQVFHSLGASRPGGGGPQPGGGARGQEPPPGVDEDDVIDAEFTAS